MPRRVSCTSQARRALLRHQTPQNPQATRTQKTLLLDSCVEWTGYHRKYVIALLNHGEHDQETIQRRRLPVLFPGNSAESSMLVLIIRYTCCRRHDTGLGQLT
jgi:hypothetical protein